MGSMTSPHADLQSRLEHARNAVRDAAALLPLHGGAEAGVWEKLDGSRVTTFDEQVEADLRGRIQGPYPRDGILGEETGVVAGTSGYTWTIDPIDGTEAFVSGIPFYSTIVGLLRELAPVAGVAEFPALDERIFASVGGGTYHQRGSRDLSQATAAGTQRLEAASMVYSGYEYIRSGGPDAEEAFLRLCRRAQSCNSWGDAYGFMLVATGRADLMIDSGVAPWDIASLVPIVHEAGGRMTTWSGGPIEFDGTHGQRIDVIACAPGIHEEVVQVLTNRQD
jgi:histidinol-phosphatase